MLSDRERAALAIEGTFEVSRVFEFTAISMCDVRSGTLVANAIPVIFAAVVGWAAQHYGWDGGFYVMIGGGVIAVVLLFITMLEEGRHKARIPESERVKK